MEEKIIKIDEEDKVRLHFADCLEVFATILDNTIDLVVTDPPYGISYKSGRQCVDRKKSVRGEGSVKCREDYFEPISEDDALNTLWLEDAYRVLKNDTAIYIFCHWKKWGQLYDDCHKYGFSVKNMIVLNKSNHGMGNLSHYAGKHELILFATKGSHKCNFPTGRENDVWNVSVKFSGARKFHPNEKPISWLVSPVANSSKVGDIVFDPFMGSGTTGIAAINMDRKFIGCEKDKEYFDIAVSRLEQAVDQKDSNIL